MTNAGRGEPWINYDAVTSLVRQLKDISLEQLVMRAVTAASVRCASGETPAATFDMLFFVKTMAALYEQKEALIRVLSGEDLRWWPDGE